ncbi:DUF1761 domain-containing protein [Pseudonocardiaceae bacterium YIM PH 21723]|nr:DUF1761 domain-containing protein [Pseudonocardiaceae bacterium YIM PH 21723]
MTGTYPAWWVPLVSTLAFFVVGGIWYSPLVLLRPYQRLAGLTDADMQGDTARTFGGSFLAALLANLTLACIIGTERGGWDGLLVGAGVSLGLVATAFVTTGLFERKPFALALIQGSYYVVAGAASGLIIGWLG